MTEEEEPKEDEKKEEKPSWKNLPPVVLILAGIVIIIIIKNMTNQELDSGSMMFWLIAIAILIYILSQVATKKDESIITPRHAKFLVYQDIERARKCREIPLMAKCKVNFVSDLHHKDGRGTYYDVSLTIDDPYDIPKYLIAKVMAKGIEKGFVTISKSIGEMTGREVIAEKSLIPRWVDAANKNPVLEKLFFRGLGG